MAKIIAVSSFIGVYSSYDSGKAWSNSPEQQFRVTGDQCLDWAALSRGHTNWIVCLDLLRDLELFRGP